MRINKTIFIKNIYYMLSYAFSYLKNNSFESIEGEEFDNIYELLGEILIIGTTQQLKKGLYKEYINFADNLNTIKGHINLSETIKNRTRFNYQINCEYDEYSVNNIYNQIIKSTLQTIQKKLKKQQQKKVNELLIYFSNIDYINLNNMSWKYLHFDKNSQNYQLLLNICKLLYDSLLLTETHGNTKVNSFLDNQKDYHLYEKFILNYYIKHYPSLQPNAEVINWDLKGNTGDTTYLPEMDSDILLEYNDQILIIDAKFYRHILQKSQYKETIRNGHIYQINNYIFNKRATSNKKVSGCLLYALTNDINIPETKLTICNNTLRITTLNLNEDFNSISKQLDDLVISFFGNIKKENID